jgi:hypothetical protein
VGIEVVRIPPDWHHPVDEAGDFIVGAHHEALYYLDVSSRTAFQLYENVTEGSPISPIFSDMIELEKWLTRNGWSEAMTEFLLSNGHAPSAIIRL